MNYNENLCDLRSNGKMRENGKYHNSVIEQMLFPIDNLDLDSASYFAYSPRFTSTVI